jgi:hypothetical protein
MVQKLGGKRITTLNVENLCGKADAPTNLSSISGEVIL